MMAGRMAHFSSVVVAAGQRRPGGGDGDGGVGGREGSGVVPTVKEEWDGAVPGRGGEGQVDGVVPGRGDDVEAVGVAVASKRTQEILAS
jgi:hypothetical protein